MIKGDFIRIIHGQHSDLGIGKIEAGCVLVPERATWLEEFKAEVMAFPNVAHDDQIDSISQFLGWIEEPHQRRVIPVVGW